MRNVVRAVALAALLTTTLVTAVHAQSSDRLFLNVSAPIRIAHETLAPGAYEIAASPVRGVFTIENRDTFGRIFVNWSGLGGATIPYSDRPRVGVARNANGQATITEIYFPQSGMTYRFSFEEPKKDGVRAALRQ